MTAAAVSSQVDSIERSMAGEWKEDFRFQLFQGSVAE
jgi:hypothetical protein